MKKAVVETVPAAPLGGEAKAGSLKEAPEPEGAPEPGEEITFVAYLPPIASAIVVAGNRDGMQVKLAIPEEAMGNAAHLLLWRGRALEVTIRLHDGKSNQDHDTEESGENQDGDENRRPARRSSAKRRVAGGDPGGE